MPDHDPLAMTDAGKRLLDRIYTKVGHADEAVAAIEAEAVAAERARITRTLTREADGNIYLDIAHVLAIIEGGDDD